MAIIDNAEEAIAKMATCTKRLNSAIDEGDIGSISEIATEMMDLFEPAVDIEDYDTMGDMYNAVKALARPIEEPPRDTSYNGWTNYETWVLKLWMDNEQSSQEYWLEVAKNADSKGVLADQMQDEYEEAMPETTGVWSDLLSAALGEVDWFEIAEYLIEEVEENQRYEITSMIEAGPTSSGSCKLEDIVEGIEDLLPEAMLEEFGMYDDSEDDAAARNGIFEEICDYLNEVAPKSVSFGAHPDDPACWGFWKDEAEESA